MAVAITIATQVGVGEIFSFSGTGFTNSGSVTVKASSEDGNGGLELSSVTLKADGSGVIASGALNLVALESGHVDMTFTDVTAATTATKKIQVFETMGV